jgi:homoserine O-acetyltransferase
VAVTATKTISRNAALTANRGEFLATFNLVHAGPTALSVRYELVGSEDAPLLIVAGGISAGRHALANASDLDDGWWQSQSSILGRYRLLSIDWLGADGELDRPIDASDQARALLATLDQLGLPCVAAFVGASYGAMVGMHCAAIAPDRIPALLAISAAHRSHPFTSAQRALQRQAIELGERLGVPESGVALARKLAGGVCETLRGTVRDRAGPRSRKLRTLPRPYGRAAQRANERRCLSQVVGIHRPSPDRPRGHRRAVHVRRCA